MNAGGVGSATTLREDSPQSLRRLHAVKIRRQTSFLMEKIMGILSPKYEAQKK
jgi:hypothetical protein